MTDDDYKRRYMFRVLDSESKEWLYYSPIEGYAITNPKYNRMTIGMWSGFRDSNGKMIFDGDIVTVYGPLVYFVSLINGAFRINPVGILDRDAPNYILAEQLRYDTLGKISNITIVGNGFERKDKTND